MAVLLVGSDRGDEASIRRILCRAPISLHVHRVANGRDAIRHLDIVGRRDDPRIPDVAVVDIDGDDASTKFLAALRRHPAFHALPLVAVTADAGPDLIRRAFDFGADAVVSPEKRDGGLPALVDTLMTYWFGISRRFYVD